MAVVFPRYCLHPVDRTGAFLAEFPYETLFGHNDRGGTFAFVIGFHNDDFYEEPVSVGKINLFRFLWPTRTFPHLPCT